mgnify:CR=1 FL=1
MKLTFNIVGLLLVVTLLLSCSNDGHDSNHNHAEEVDSALNSSQSILTGMTLNDGQKWMMDEHTRDSFSTMASSFLSTDHASLNNDHLKSIGLNLQGDVDNLIQACTMQEEAHAQLHIFLTGFIPAVNDLADNGQLENAQTVAHYLDKYDQYFQ